MFKKRFKDLLDDDFDYDGTIYILKQNLDKYEK